MVTSMVVGNVVLNVVANIVYDIGKSTVRRFESKGDEINKEDVRKYVFDMMGKKYGDLCKSGVLIEYLDTPLVKDTINTYIRYKITGYIDTDFAVRDKTKNKQYSITKKEVVDFLTLKLLDRYNEGTSICKPDKQEINNFFYDTFKISTEYIYKKMGTVDKMMVFSINSRIDDCTDEMLSNFQEISSILKKSMEKEVVNKEMRYHENKERYIKILKNYNKSAHIYLLDQFDLCKFYVPPFLEVRSYSKSSGEMRLSGNTKCDIIFKAKRASKTKCFDDWKNIFLKKNLVYITGGAGYGKTLFMKNIIINYEKMNIFDSKDYLVIYGELKGFYPNNSENPISVVNFLQESITNNTLIEKETVTIEFIQYYLNIGRCIILLDALDEVEKTKRDSLHKRLVSYFRCENPNNKICITSRSRGFFPEEDIEVIEIEPLERDQIEKYIDNIIRLNGFEIEDKAVFLEQSSVLVEKGFLCSFLVLSLLINIYKAERELPENKLELYQKCFEYISKNREKDKAHDQNHWRLITPLLNRSAFMELSNLCLPNNAEADKEKIKNKLIDIYKVKYLSECEVEEAVDKFLLFCADRTELFVPSAGEDKFNFFHRSFFEYFYSQYLFTRKNTVKEIYECFIKFDVDSEIFELTLATIKQNDENKYQELIEHIFSILSDSESIESEKLIAFNILILGMQVIDDEVYKKKLIEYIAQNKEFILKNEEIIYGTDILANLIKNNHEYLEIINNTFKDQAIISTVKKFNRIFLRIKMYEGIIFKGSVSEETETEVFKYMVRNNVECIYENFYAKTYFSQYSIKKVFENITREQIREYAGRCNLTEDYIITINKEFMDYKKTSSFLKRTIDEILFEE